MMIIIIIIIIIVIVIVIMLMRYGAGILNWRVNEVDQMDRKTRKILTINK